MGAEGTNRDVFLRTIPQPRKLDSAGRDCGQAGLRTPHGSAKTEVIEIHVSDDTQSGSKKIKIKKDFGLSNDPLIAVLLLQQQGQPLQKNSQTQSPIQPHDVLTSEDHAASCQRVVLTDPIRSAADQQKILKRKEKKTVIYQRSIEVCNR